MPLWAARRTTKQGWEHRSCSGCWRDASLTRLPYRSTRLGKLGTLSGPQSSTAYSRYHSPRKRCPGELLQAAVCVCCASQVCQSGAASWIRGLADPLAERCTQHMAVPVVGGVNALVDTAM